MKILLYGINYAPELTGIGKYSAEMCRWLVRQGHEVDVITAPPYYPQWSVQDAYRGRGWQSEWMDGVRVYRCPLYVPAQPGGGKRIVHEASFVLSSLRWWIPFMGRKYDLIFCICPPFHLGLIPLFYRLFHKTKIIYHVQDLQVDAARKLGILSKEWLLRFLERMESWIMHRVDVVSTISTGMQQKIANKGIPVEKIPLLPNWVDSNKVYSTVDNLRVEWGFTAKHKIILYAGNLGEKQGLELIPQVATHFQEQTDVQFVIVGEGGAKSRLIEQVKAAGLSNVHFFPLQPLAKLSAMLNTADLHLVLQKRAAADLVMPSKLTNILAVGGVSIVTAEPGSTLYDTVHAHQLGILCRPEEVEALREAIQESLTNDLEDYRQHARAYAQQYLNMNGILGRFFKIDAV